MLIWTLQTAFFTEYKVYSEDEKSLELFRWREKLNDKAVFVQKNLLISPCLTKKIETILILLLYFFLSIVWLGIIKRSSYAVCNEVTYKTFVQSNPIIDIVTIVNPQFDNVEINPLEEGFEAMPTCFTSNSLIHSATHALIIHLNMFINSFIVYDYSFVPMPAPKFRIFLTTKKNRVWNLLSSCPNRITKIRRKLSNSD